MDCKIKIFYYFYFIAVRWKSRIRFGKGGDVKKNKEYC